MAARVIGPKMTKFLGAILLLVAGLAAFGIYYGDGETTAGKPVSATVEEELPAHEQERLARLKSLQEAVKKIPATDYMTNLNMYDELRRLDPDDKRFQQRYAHYNAKKDEALAMQWYPERFVKIVDLSWERAFLGTIMELDLTIKNALRHPVKDIKFRCVHSAPSGTVIDTNERVIREVIEAGSTRSFRNINMGFMGAQVAQTDCSVVGVTRAG